VRSERWRTRSKYA